MPAEMVLGAAGYLPMLRGIKPPGGVRIHISGIDLIRDPAGTWRVLEDNLRTPSGVSYVVENRLLIQARVPARVRRRAGPPRRPLPDAARRDAALGVARVEPTTRNAVVLTPGPYNSAYFEHTLPRAHDGPRAGPGARSRSSTTTSVFCRTTRGPRRVHVIYRRTDEAFLDPEVFRPDSVLGVPGPDARLRRRQRRARERARQRRRRRQGRLPVRARHDPVLPGRGAAARAGADVRVPARRRSRATCSSTSTRWW